MHRRNKRQLLSINLISVKHEYNYFFTWYSNPVFSRSHTVLWKKKSDKAGWHR